MAQSKTRDELSDSVQAGSEEMFDYFCQPCNPDKHLEAVSYCQDCCEYLCITCTEYHGKLSATKKHAVLGQSAMPKTTALPKIGNTDVLTEKCRKHHDKVYEYFCQSHQQICCSVCVTLDHISCSDKSYVPDLSDGIARSQEYKHLTVDLDRLVGEIAKQEEQSNDASKTNEQCYSKALANIKVLRKQINELLDKIEKDTKDKINNFHQNNADVIRSVSERCQSLLLEVKAMATDIVQLAKAGKNNNLFVQVKLSSDRVAEFEKQKRETSKYKVTRYSFEHGGKVQQMMSTLSSLWSLTARLDDTPTKTRYVREVGVKSRDDKMDCLINGIALLPNDRMVSVDFENKTIKLFDMQVNTCLSTLSFSSGPFDVTKVKPNQVAVALGNEKKIEIINASSTLSKNRSITTPGAVVVGLCHDGSNFIAACQNPGSVNIIDISGNTLKKFNTNINEEHLFKTPRYIALNNDKTVIYITDKGANTVTIMTTRGGIISVYRSDNFKWPSAVTVGKDGIVYVCSRDTHTVHQLTATGDLMRIITQADQGMSHFPVSMAYDDAEDILYISSHSSAPAERNYIRLYQLE